MLTGRVTVPGERWLSAGERRRYAFRFRTLLRHRLIQEGAMSEWMIYTIGAVVIIIVAALVLRHVNRDPKSPGV